MNDEINISLEILLLNDLLHMNAIDKELYDATVKKINSNEKETQAA